MPRKPRRIPGGRLVARTETLGRALPPDEYSDQDRHVDFKTLFGTVQGKRVLALILAQCHFWVSTDRGEDTHATAYLNGMREVGLWLLEITGNEPMERPEEVESE